MMPPGGSVTASPIIELWLRLLTSHTGTPPRSEMVFLPLWLGDSVTG